MLTPAPYDWKDRLQLPFIEIGCTIMVPVGDGVAFLHKSDFSEGFSWDSNANDLVATFEPATNNPDSPLHPNNYTPLHALAIHVDTPRVVAMAEIVKWSENSAKWARNFRRIMSLYEDAFNNTPALRDRYDSWYAFFVDGARYVLEGLCRKVRQWDKALASISSDSLPLLNADEKQLPTDPPAPLGETLAMPKRGHGSSIDHDTLLELLRRTEALSKWAEKQLDMDVVANEFGQYYAWCTTPDGVVLSHRGHKRRASSSNETAQKRPRVQFQVRPVVSTLHEPELVEREEASVPDTAVLRTEDRGEFAMPDGTVVEVSKHEDGSVENLDFVDRVYVCVHDTETQLTFPANGKSELACFVPSPDCFVVTSCWCGPSPPVAVFRRVNGRFTHHITNNALDYVKGVLLLQDRYIIHVCATSDGQQVECFDLDSESEFKWEWQLKHQDDDKYDLEWLLSVTEDHKLQIVCISADRRQCAVASGTGLIKNDIDGLCWRSPLRRYWDR